MSSFAGVSVLADGGLCPATESFVDAGTDCGYHLMVVQDYRRTKQEAPTGDSITSRPFTVGGHDWYLHYYPNGENQSCADYVSLTVSRLYDEEGADEVVDAKFGFSFVDQVEEQNPVCIRGTETCSFPFPGSSWSCGKFVRRDALERSANLRGDCFTIRCDIMVVRDTKGYDLQRLKFICEKQLSDLIGVSSVASTLALAERHHCRGLNEACIKFIQAQSPSCLQTIMATDGWEHIIATYPSVLNELIAKVIALNQATSRLYHSLVISSDAAMHM